MEYKWNYNDIYKRYISSHNFYKKEAYEYLLNFESGILLINYKVEDIVNILNKRPISTEIYFSDTLYNISNNLKDINYDNKGEIINISNGELINYALKFYKLYNIDSYNYLLKNILNKSIKLYIDDKNKNFVGQTIFIDKKEIYVYTKKDNMLDEIFTLIHEFRHVLDECKNTKYPELKPLYTELYAQDYYSNCFNTESSRLLFKEIISRISKYYYIVHTIYKDTLLQKKQFIEEYINNYLKTSKLTVNELYYLVDSAFEYKEMLISYLLALYLNKYYTIYESDKMVLNNKEIEKILIKNY